MQNHLITEIIYQKCSVIVHIYEKFRAVERLIFLIVLIVRLIILIAR